LQRRQLDFGEILLGDIVQQPGDTSKQLFEAIEILYRMILADCLEEIMDLPYSILERNFYLVKHTARCCIDRWGRLFLFARELPTHLNHPVTDDSLMRVEKHSELVLQLLQTMFPIFGSHCDERPDFSKNCVMGKRRVIIAMPR